MGWNSCLLFQERSRSLDTAKLHRGTTISGLFKKASNQNVPRAKIGNTVAPKIKPLPSEDDLFKLTSPQTTTALPLNSVYCQVIMIFREG